MEPSPDQDSGPANTVIHVHGGIHVTDHGRHPVRTTTLVTLIVLATGAGIWLMIANRPVAPAPATRPIAQQNARTVQQCESQHRLSTQTTKKQTSDTAITFDACAWPAPTFADADGFAEITVDMVQGPGQVEASDATEVDRITGPCRQFRLTYDYGFMGGLEHLPSFSAPPGTVTSLDTPGSAWYPGVPGLGFYPSRDEVDVVHNNHNSIADVSCAD